MREPWMMFTKDQAQELIDNTTYIWIEINGVKGYKFTNKTDSSKYIFLPEAGHWEEVAGYWGPGIYGFYWSTKYNSGQHAHYLELQSSDRVDNERIGYFWSGNSIRSIRQL